jgi:hypothetical protein
VIEKREQINHRRLLRVLFHRGLFSAFLRVYYMQLEKLAFLRGSPLLKLAFNELIGSWIVNGFFLVTNAILNGQDVEQALRLTPTVVKAG